VSTKPTIAPEAVVEDVAATGADFGVAVVAAATSAVVVDAMAAAVGAAVAVATAAAVVTSVRIPVHSGRPRAIFVP
jgi:hypothetical protein